MYVVVVSVRIAPGQGAAFLRATQLNHEGTRRTEPGNLRYDVLRLAAPAAEGEPEQFLLYEVYRTPEDFAAHQQTPHYLAWRDAVAPLLAEPRQGVRYVSVYPDPWE
jgi:autoinducer 2-degrading protein